MATTAMWLAMAAWWSHQMETFSALLALCAGNSPVTGEFPQKGQWRRALMFSLICAWMSGWVNNHKGGNLRCHCAHYEITVMYSRMRLFFCIWKYITSLKNSLCESSCAPIWICWLQLEILTLELERTRIHIPMQNCQQCSWCSWVHYLWNGAPCIFAYSTD